MYRMPVAGASGGLERVVEERGAREDRLAFATVAIDQPGGGSPWKPDVRPRFESITRFHGRANHALGDKVVESTATARLGSRARRNKLGDHAAVRRDRDTLASVDPPYVATQVVFQLADASRLHRPDYSYMWPHPQTPAGSGV